MSNFKIGIVSGYFNPLHAGHIEYINAAKKQCDYLICIINNDDQVKLKGSALFMDEDHRKIIVENLKGIDFAVVSIDDDLSVSQTLENISNLEGINENCRLLFFNSGDRNPENQNLKEVNICKDKNIERVFLDLPKIYSSSTLKLNLTT